jgi:chemosensory pili system protein ChpA (sensor histidine kinase/response regulator)
MASVDQHILLGFIEEAKGYLPAILDGIEALFQDPDKQEVLAEIYRLTHSIKGAASMVGLSRLSHLTYFAEEVLEEVAAGNIDLTREAAGWLMKLIGSIECYLDGISSNQLSEWPILSAATTCYRRLKGLPEAGDEAAAAELLAGEEKAPDKSPVREAAQQRLAQADDAWPQLMEVFLLEAQDHLHNIAVLLPGLDKEPENRERLQEVRRSAHTIKGAAAMVGLDAVTQLAHRLEDLLDSLYDGERGFSPEMMNLLLASSDALEMLVSGEVKEAAYAATLAELYAHYRALLESEPAAAPKASAIEAELESLSEEQIIDLAEFTALAFGEENASAASTDEPTPRKASQLMRIPIARLDELIKATSELVISRSIFEQRFSSLVREVDELRLSLERLRRISTKFETEYEVVALASGKPGQQAVSGHSLQPATSGSSLHGFDELEFDRYTEFHLLSRELTETASDVSAVGSELRNIIGDFDTCLTRMGRLTSEVQDKLMRLRMVPLATLTQRLHRAVRVTAAQQDKRVELIIEGERVELDKTVLEEVTDPLFHLLRNAVAHGIEPPAVRCCMGKEEQGRICLRAFYEGTQVVIQISDDGAGLDAELIREAAVNQGYLTKTEAAGLSAEGLYSLIFLPGFSTAREVSEVSGRGVGMDIVKSTVQKMKGTVTIDSTPGRGVMFSLRLPMTLAITRVLLVRANYETFAIPLGVVAKMLRVDREEVERIGQVAVIRVDGQSYPLVRLGEALNLKQPADNSAARLPILIVNLDGQRVALVVDHLLEQREVVVKTLGSHLRRIPGITGATLMGDGSVVLILNPTELMPGARPSGAPPALSAAEPAARWRETFNVLIVDDSLSVRTVVSNLIKSVGWNPVTAKDGLEALQILQDTAAAPDVVLLDIEMPRMDGYELTSALRSQEVCRDLPIIMLTSRAGDKHRQKAFDLGVTEYLVKPYQDEVLLQVIRRVAAASRCPPFIAGKDDSRRGC